MSLNPTPLQLDIALEQTDRQHGQPALDEWGRALGTYECSAGAWAIRLPGGALYQAPLSRYLVDGED